MSDMITTKHSPLLTLQGKYHVQRNLPGIPVVSQTHPNPASLLILWIWTFVLSSNQYVAAQSVH